MLGLRFWQNISPVGQTNFRIALLLIARHSLNVTLQFRVLRRKHYEHSNLVMANNSQARTIEESPIGNSLDAFRTSFNSICERRSLPYTSDAFNDLTQEGKDVRNTIAVTHLTVIQISKMSHSTYCLICETFPSLGSYHPKPVMVLFRTISGD